jgi:hypothetical protein
MGDGLKRYRIIRHSLNRNLMDSERINSCPGQNGPQAGCQVNTSKFDGIEVFADAGKGEPVSASYSLLR